MCEPVANPRICRESVANPANPLRTCANQDENFCEFVANLRESAQLWWRTFGLKQKAHRIWNGRRAPDRLPQIIFA
eukprot:5184242-Prymnesium_polylepis.1